MTTAPTILQILTHTPIWVWAIFAFVVFMGYQRTRDRVVQVWRLMLFPLLLALLALSGMLGAGLAVLPAAAVGLVVGGGAGWLMEREGATRRLPDGRLWLRGEWWSLLQVVLIFGVRYATAVVAATNPALAGDVTWHLTTVLVSTLLSGLVLARTAARLRVYFTSAPAAA